MSFAFKIARFWKNGKKTAIILPSIQVKKDDGED